MTDTPDLQLFAAQLIHQLNSENYSISRSKDMRLWELRICDPDEYRKYENNYYGVTYFWTHATEELEALEELRGRIIEFEGMDASVPHHNNQTDVSVLDESGVCKWILTHAPTRTDELVTISSAARYLTELAYKHRKMDEMYHAIKSDYLGVIIMDKLLAREWFDPDS